MSSRTKRTRGRPSKYSPEFRRDAVGLVLLSVGVLLVAPTHRDAPLHDMGGAPGGFGGLAGLPFALAVFGYIGWENAGPLAEESTNPRRTIPLTIVASVLDLPLETTAAEEGSAYGAAMLAGCASRTFADPADAVARCVRVRSRTEPDADWVRAYADGYRRFGALYPALAGLR